jgi:multisubunit Na+/H+ antiporter MnhB subunit
MYLRFSPLVATAARTIAPTLVLFSVYLLVVGHDSPGGGFAGGLLGSAALLLVYLAYGDRGVWKTLPTDPEIIAGVGLTFAAGAAMLGMVVEGQLLAAISASAEVPLLGDVKVSSVLLFDTGVYLVVVGLVGTAIVRLGGDGRQ